MELRLEKIEKFIKGIDVTDDIGMGSHICKQLSETYDIDIKYAESFYSDFITHTTVVSQLMFAINSIGEIRMNDLMRARLLLLGSSHDNSKLYDYYECGEYIKLNRDLKGVEYGTEEYNKIIKSNKAVELHYKNNAHHPEHHKEGFKDMAKDIALIIEMLCDWMAAHYRKNKSLETFDKSLEINKERFQISDHDIEKLCILLDAINFGIY